MKRIIGGAIAGTLALASAVGCSSAPTDGTDSTEDGLRQVVVVNRCVFNHLSVAGQDPSLACAGTSFSDWSELPPDLARAGCTRWGSYQLGLGQKGLRYAVCPQSLARCVRNLGCFTNNPGIDAFLQKYAAGDDAAPYSWARTRTDACDACFGMPAPSGSTYVTWHDRDGCPGDEPQHDADIASGLGIPNPYASGGSSGGKCTIYHTSSGCYGGCMLPGAPPQ